MIFNLDGPTFCLTFVSTVFYVVYLLPTREAAPPPIGQKELNQPAREAALNRTPTREAAPPPIRQKELNQVAREAALNRASTRKAAPPPIGQKELNKLAREAAFNRAREAHNRNRPRKRRTNPRLLGIVEANRQLREREQQRDPNAAPSPEEQANILSARSFVFSSSETGTVFRIIPTLASSEVAHKTLQRIAKEFLPIIQERGYNVRSVSEFYHENGRGSDADGLDFELGGTNRSLRPGDSIKVEGDIEDTLGYNSGPLVPRCVRCDPRFRPKPEYTIHLRLREAHIENLFRPYEDVARTMVHELAHCVERHHEPSFWKLNDEIFQQYQNSRQQAKW